MKHMVKWCNRRIIRKVLAGLFLILIGLLFVWSIKKDSQLKVDQMFLGGFRNGEIHYTIQLKSFNPENETFSSTVSVGQGMLPMWLDGEKIRYGPLAYDDLTFPYAIGFPLISQRLVAELGAFRAAFPPTKEIGLKAVGNPETYPFDKYFVMGSVKCPAYFTEGKTKKYLQSQDHGESIGVLNSINGFFIRKPKKEELNEIRASFNITKRPLYSVEDKDLAQINNNKDTFAVMIVRPYYLQFMTVVLGVFALVIAFYIGFIMPLRDKAIALPGFVFAVWGIRSILLADTKMFLAHFDYVVLFLYLLIVVGITFRLIYGEKNKNPRPHNPLT